MLLQCHEGFCGLFIEALDVFYRYVLTSVWFYCYWNFKLLLGLRFLVDSSFLKDYLFESWFPFCGLCSPYQFFLLSFCISFTGLLFYLSESVLSFMFKYFTLMLCVSFTSSFVIVLIVFVCVTSFPCFSFSKLSIHLSFSEKSATQGTTLLIICLSVSLWLKWQSECLFMTRRLLLWPLMTHMIAVDLLLVIFSLMDRLQGQVHLSGVRSLLDFVFSFLNKLLICYIWFLGLLVFFLCPLFERFHKFTGNSPLGKTLKFYAMKGYWAANNEVPEDTI